MSIGNSEVTKSGRRLKLRWQLGLCYKALSGGGGKSLPPFGRPQKSRFHSFVTRLVFLRIRDGNAQQSVNNKKKSHSLKLEHLEDGDGDTMNDILTYKCISLKTT